MELPWNVAKLGTWKARVLVAVAWVCNPVQWLPCVVWVERARVGNDYGYVKLARRK